MVGSLGYERELPGEDEFEMYMQLDKRGWKCGVHDPDFAEPLEGCLHLERGLRYSLRLECEDETLSFSRPVHQLRAEPRDTVQGGRGLALVDLGSTPGGTDAVRIVVADCNEERDCLAHVIERLQHDPRSFRRAKKAFLGCLPAGGCGASSAGCAAAPCGRPRRRRPHSSPAAPSLPGSGEQRDLGVAPSPGSRSRSAGREAQPPILGLDEARQYVRAEWDKAKAFKARKNSGSLSSFLRSGAATPKAGAASPGPATPRVGDTLDGERCGMLLARLLASEGPAADAAKVGHGGIESDLWQRRVSDLFSGPGDGGMVSFTDFWGILEQTLLASTLWSEPGLQKYLREGDLVGMTLEKWRWFLVQIQDEPRGAVEAADAQLANLRVPDIDKNRRLTLYGLSRYLCSPANGLLAPERCNVHCDMSRPLSDYWVAATHHIHADPPKPVAGDEVDTASRAPPEACEPRGALQAAILSGCRCLGLALDAARGELQVLLQQDRMPLAEVLQFVDQYGFEKSPFPLLLVLHLGLLSASDCMAVPDALAKGLGRRLWRGESGGLPSPEEARGRVVVVLAPAARGLDPSLEPEVPAALRGPAQGPPGGSGAPDERAAALLAVWEEAAKAHAVWPGRPLDPRLAPPPPGEVCINFIGCDELRSLQKAQLQMLVEYHRHCLTIAFPVASRRAPANFNAAAAWTAGVQMAALSLSCSDADGAALAHAGRFAQDNGGCGYVLKPLELRGAGSGQGAAVAAPVRLDLRLRVLAARAVPGADGDARPTGPTALAVSVWGATGDCARQVYRPARPSGPTIAWPEAAPAADGSAPKPLAFSIASPATAILVMELLDLDPRVGGPRRLAFSATPVDGLRQGLRWAPLWTLGSGGEARPVRCGPLSGLLVHAAIERKRLAVRP